MQREYSFYPRTWVLPAELSDFRAQFDHYGNSIANKIYIIKPDTGCQVSFLPSSLQRIYHNIICCEIVESVRPVLSSHQYTLLYMNYQSLQAPWISPFPRASRRSGPRHISHAIIWHCTSTRSCGRSTVHSPPTATGWFQIWLTTVCLGNLREAVTVSLM